MLKTWVIQHVRTQKFHMSGPTVYSYTLLLATGEGKTLKAGKRKQNCGNGISEAENV